MDEDMIVRGMADKTREAYLGAVRGLAKFYRRSPDQISDEEVQRYLLYLIQDRKQAWSTCNIAVQGLKFLYHTTLKRDRTTFTIPAPRQPSKLPAILSQEEVHRVIAHAANLTHRTMLLTAYAAGLRLSEVIHLRVQDIDATRMTIRVEQGKGRKDRYTVLSASLRDALRAYWKVERPRGWLFPARRGDRPLDPSSLQKAYQLAKRRAGIVKPGGIHALRSMSA
jgi:site-specific recombinase XerD